MIERTIFIKTAVQLFAAALLGSCGDRPSATPATPETIRQEIESSTAPVTLVHVWATWCQPCLEEFPELLDAYERFRKKGIELILVSADDPSERASVEAFLLKQDSPLGTLISTELSEKFIETLSPTWAGSLPASFFYADGRLLAEWEGKRTREQYAETFERLLKQ
jgi:thiol-disulfide isomerase/thioredoxin